MSRPASRNIASRSLLSILALTVLALAAGLAAFFGAPRSAAQEDPFALPAVLHEAAVFSCQELGASGGAVITSEGLDTVGALGGRGHVRSNADIRLDGTAEIQGDALAGPGGQVILNGSPAQVTGTVGNASELLDCAPLDLAALEAALGGANDNASIPLSDKGRNPLGGAGGLDFELTGKDRVVLPAGDYLFRSLKLTGNSALELAGPVRILVTGDVELTGGSHIHLNGSPYDLRLWSSGSSVRIASRSIVHAHVYAPDAEVVLSGQGRLVGGVFAGRVDLVGGARVLRVLDDQPPSLTVTSPLEGDVVAACSVEVTGTALDSTAMGDEAVGVTVNGEAAAVAEDGSFSLLVTLSGPEADLIVVEATDDAGNVVREEIRVVLPEPSAVLVSPAPGALVGSRVVTLQGTLTAANTVTVNGTAAQVAGDAFSVPAFDLGGEGLRTLELTASGCGGETSSAVVLDVDTLAPAVAIDSPAPGHVFGASPVAVTGTVVDAHPASVTVNGVAAQLTGTGTGVRFSASGVPLTEGANTLTVTALDAVGRSATASVQVVLDTTAPTVVIDTPAPGSLVGASPITVEGAISDANLASVTVNGVAAQITASGSGARFSAAGVTLAEGENRLTATAVDQVGNTSESAPVVVVLDTLAPALTVEAPTVPVSEPLLLTDASVLTLSGTVDDANLDAVTVSAGGADHTAVVVGDRWVADGLPLAEGENSFVVTARDLLGRETAAPAVVVTRDTQAPAVTLTEPLEGADLGSRTFTVRGTVAEPHLDRVTVLGSPAVLGASSGGVTPFEASVTVPADGEVEITARAVDLLGAASEAAPRLVLVDTQAPAVRLASPTDPITGEATVTVSGTVEDLHLASLEVAGIPAVLTGDPALGEAAFTVTGVPLAEGDNLLSAVAVDDAGNRAVSEPVLYVRDTRPPAVGFDLPAVADGACLAPGAAYDLGGSFGEVNPDLARPVWLRVRPTGGAAFEVDAALNPDGDRWSAAGVSLGAVDGTATVTVTAADALGETVSRGRTFRLDGTAPLLALTLDGGTFPGAQAGEPPPGDPAQLAPTAVFNRSVTVGVSVEDGASEPPAAELLLDGAPYAPGTPISAEGVHVVTARVADCAGRTVAAYAVFRIDRTPPALLGTSPADGAALGQAPAALTGTASEALASVRVNGAPAAVGPGPGGTPAAGFTLSPLPWKEGANALKIELVDTAGNRSAHTVSFRVDTRPLTVELLEGGLPIASGATFLRAVRPEARASDPAAGLSATLNGAPFVSGTEIAESGTYTLAATAVDALGRSASASVSFSVDRGAAPQLAILAPTDGSAVSGDAVTVSGTAAATGGGAVSVVVNGVSAPVSGGAWSASVPLDPDGLNLLTAVATDAAGRSTSRSVTVNAVAGGVRLLILEPADGARTGRARTDVVGTVVGGSRETVDGRVTVTNPAGETFSADVATDGRFRVLDVALAEGSNLLTARATGRGGAVSEASVTVVSDRTPPAIEITADGAPLAEGATFGGPVVLGVRVVGEEGASLTRLRLNGADQTITGAFTEIPLTADGGYVLSASAADAAGNQARVERSFLLDLSACALGAVQPGAGSAVAGAAVTLTGSSGTATEVRVRVPRAAGGFDDYAASLADGTFLAADVPLPVVGVNALQLVCTGAGGETVTAEHPVERLAGGAGPQVVVESPADGSLTAAGAVTVTGRVVGGLGGGSVTVNGRGATLTEDASGDTLFQVPDLALVEGPNLLAVRAVDGAGRSGAARVRLERDGLAPRLSLTSPQQDALVGRAGTAPSAPFVAEVTGVVDLTTEPHLDRVTVSAASTSGTPGASVAATVDAASGAFRALVPLDAGLPAGNEQVLTAVAADTLGHSASVSVRVRIDAAGPAITLSLPEDLAVYGPGSPATVTVQGQAWGAEGARISLNGAYLDPATLAWSAPDADGRRAATFSAAVALPAQDGPFAVLARVVELDGDLAETRRLLARDRAAPEVVELIPADGAAGVDGAGLLLALFSEPLDRASLAAADGLTLVRLATGDPVVGEIAVAGTAVAFVPGAALAAGESYRFRAGSGIRDLAGQALAAPGESTFTVAEAASGAAPVLDPLPAVFCAAELVVRGTASPGATLRVRDGDLTFTGFADSAGRFAVTVPLAGEGYHLLRVAALDGSGAASPEASAAVRLDCGAPTVAEATFDRTAGVVRVTFSEAMDPASLAIGGDGDALRLSDAEDGARTAQAGVLSLGSSAGGATVAEVQLDTAADAWWRERPVRLEARAPAADAEGSPLAAAFETVFFPGSVGGAGGGFLSGEVYDDSTGRPLAGARAERFLSGGADPLSASPLASTLSGGRGRYTLSTLTSGASSPAPGRYAVLLTLEGYTRGVRRLALEPSAVAVPFDSRLTPLAPAAGEIDPASGGRAQLGTDTPAFEADALALPGTDPAAVRLTPLTGQGLPDVLPLGWTPAAAVDVRLEAAGAVLPDGEAAGLATGGARVELPLPAWVAAGDDLVAARYELATGLWRSLEAPERFTAADGSPWVRLSVVGPGAAAVLLADEEPANRPAAIPTLAGEALVGAPFPATLFAEGPADLTATLTLDPEVVPPTGKALARVTARSADGVSPWPSGLAVQAYLEERLHLAGGGTLLEAPFSVDLLLYHPRLSAEEQGASAAGSAGALEVTVSPSPRAAEVLLDVGFENIRLFPFPVDVERGNVLGPVGGGVETADGVEVLLPEGALAEATAVEAELLTAAELAALDPVAGYQTLAAVRLGFGGRTLARPATLRVPLPAGAPAETPGDARLILAERVELAGDGRGGFPRLAARALLLPDSGAAPRAEAAPEPVAGLPAGLPLEGIVREGLYLLLRAESSLGYATGRVSLPGGGGLAGARVSTAGLGTRDLSADGGRYALPVLAGSGREVAALHPLRDESGTGVLASLAPEAVASLDLTVTSVAPSILSVAPADGSTEQPTGSSVSVLFSEPLSADGITGATLTLERLDASGNVEAALAGTVSLSADAARVIFTPSRPLTPGRRFRASFHGGVRDVGGTPYAGPVPVTWTFRTTAAAAPGGEVDPSRFHLRLPVGGVSAVVGDPGALPVPVAGQAPWTVAVEVETPSADGFPVADPVVDSFPGAADGSFTASAGHPPSHPVTPASRVWVKVFAPDGSEAAHFRLSPFTSPDGLGFVAPAGEAVTFRSAEGVWVDVPAGAFTEATVVRVALRPPAEAAGLLPAGMAAGAFVEVDFEGTAAESLIVGVPAPAAAPDGAQVFIGEPLTLPWGRRLRLLSVGGVLERGGERLLTNDPAAQPSGFTARSLAPNASAPNSLERRALPEPTREGVFTEFRARSEALYAYEDGVDYALITGTAASLGFSTGAGNEAIYNSLADSWVYTPTPYNWNGRFALPVPVGEALELTLRDLATGWLGGTAAIDPIADDPGGFVDVDGQLDGGDVPPMLVDARPFHVLPFAAPGAGESLALRLGITAETDTAGRLTLRSAADFPLAEHTTLALFDLAPTREEDGSGLPLPPLPGPRHTVCAPPAPWSTQPTEAGDDLLLIIAPGDLDAGAFRAFEFQMDRPLDEVSERPADELAVLTDLGPAEGCTAGSGSAGAAAGYPRAVALDLALTAAGHRLVITPRSRLAAGHRYRLELVAGGLRARGEDGPAYPADAPRQFDFATRGVPGDVLGSLPEGRIPTEEIGRVQDLLGFGNLLVAASTAGDLVAFDTSDPSGKGTLALHSIKTTTNDHARSLATDGHGRVFYAGRFNSVWGIKSLRVEEARAAGAACGDQPAWAAGVPCFEGDEGAVRVSYSPGATSGLLGSEWLAFGALPSGNPSDLEVLPGDEVGLDLETAELYAAYTGGALTAASADAEGGYTFDLPLRSSYLRATSNAPEPSRVGTPGEGARPPAAPAWRTASCEGEPAHDRYQRVTVENLTSGRSWSVDIENPWPTGSGDGTAVARGIRARRGDRLRVRYNLSVLGYTSIVGSGVTVVDLNRSYRLEGGAGGPADKAGQCGRRLTAFEGQDIDWPACVGPFPPQGLSATPSLAVQGGAEVNLYSPLMHLGAVRLSASSADGGARGLSIGETALCANPVAGEASWMRDSALARDVEWLDSGLRSKLDGTVNPPAAGAEPMLRRGDLFFLSLGDPGVFVFDVSDRRLDEAHLVGRLSVPGHSVARLQVDEARSLLFAGGLDTTGAEPRPVIDVWDLAAVNSAPGTDGEARPVATVHAPWSAQHLALDPAGTGLLTTWDDERGPVTVPFERPAVIFSGLYRPAADEGAEAGDDPAYASLQATRTFVPLGVPLETDPQAEEDNRAENEARATGAFRVRFALPGSLGEELTVKVQSLRALPDERFLAEDDLGPAAALPGGPGWPEPEVYLTLRRVGEGAASGTAETAGDGGRFSPSFNFYESVETVLLLADPRARGAYRRQDLPDGADAVSRTADEAAQCRRCDWPSYLPDPEATAANDPERLKIRELLAGGRYLRAYLAVDPASSGAARANTEAALAHFTSQGANYPAPAGWAEVAGWAAPVPSPVQVSLAEPARSAAVWSPGEAGVSSSLVSGELMLEVTDHQVDGRGLPFRFGRTYHSGTLGYGPLGAAGWHSAFFARLRELPATGELEYHDGTGRVWRFLPRTAAAPDGWEEDQLSGYHVPEGLYVRLQKLPNREGWRLLDRYHAEARFDEDGRLTALSDRFRQGAAEGEQGNTLRLRHDAFGRLVEVVDDLARVYRFTYYDDPRPVAQGGDGPRYGLLRTLRDFAGRTVEYVWSEDRTLTEVRMPEVGNASEAYADFSYRGAERPSLRYDYDPAAGVSASEAQTTAVLHGDFAALRLGGFHLPDFVEAGTAGPRARFEYDAATGRLAAVGMPVPDGRNETGASVEWRLAYQAAGSGSLPSQVTLREPWGHEAVHQLTGGRVTRHAEELDVEAAGAVTVETTFAYTDDGRLTSVGLPDGGRRVHCYADGEGGDGCDGGGSGAAAGAAVDRLARPNVTQSLEGTDTSGGSGGSGDVGIADYTRVAVEASYQGDNLPSEILDGLGRRVSLPTPEVSSSVSRTFHAEGVSTAFSFDRFGRVESTAGAGDGGPQTQLSYGADARGTAGAGLLSRVEQGPAGAPAVWEEYRYDAAYNPEERRTSYGEVSRAVYDEWDRWTQSTSGLSEGALAEVGPAAGQGCAAGPGAQAERAFDAAGHVVRERRLQDVVGADGAVTCRWVESRYTYNAREQLTEVEESHLADPLNPGSVLPGMARTTERRFDAFGRVEEILALNLASPSVVTRYRYDAASRVAGMTVGDAGEQTLGYDVKSRVVRKTDGDQGTWQGRYDVWDRLYYEQQPTGAVVTRRFDEAHNLLEQNAFDGDPTLPGSELLARVESEFTSFGAVSRAAQRLTDPDGASPELLVTETDFDESGRPLAVWSGPGDPSTGLLDRSAARREREVIYEADTGRVLLESRGGLYGSPALYAVRSVYLAENDSPWPDRTEMLESVPGRPDLALTETTSYQRDVLGRVIRQTTNSGAAVDILHDRSGGPILTRTGAGSVNAVTTDGRGLPLVATRPDGRGLTRFAYDLDGRLLQREKATSGEGESASPWITSYSYDTVGRPIRIDHADGTFETATYFPDHQVATRTTREGVLLTHTYDAANRLLSLVPTALDGTTLPETLAPLDAGDAYSYDTLSRLTAARRGTAGLSGLDPSLTVATPTYDLGGRPLSEVVGNRAPMVRGWDTWSRPETLTLPEGPGRTAGGAFTGFTRTYL